MIPHVTKISQHGVVEKKRKFVDKTSENVQFTLTFTRETLI